MARKPNELIIALEKLQSSLKEEEITLRKLVSTLSGRGYPLIIILLSLPFCLPVTIPGFSTPFGFALAFMGARIALGRKMWWPKWLLDKKLSSKSMNKIISWVIKILRFFEPILHPRLLFLTQNPFLHRLNGFLIIIMSLLLAIPLPIPLTNTMAALPIVFLALGLLEDDGLFIILGYFFVLLGISFFYSLYYLGGKGFNYLLNSANDF